jgi:integrase
MVHLFAAADRKQGVAVDEKITGHSLRKGGATSLFLRGVDETLIQALGRWSSDAYKVYAVLNRTVMKDAQTKMMRTQATDLAVGKTRWTGGQWRTKED